MKPELKHFQDHVTRAVLDIRIDAETGDPVTSGQMDSVLLNNLRIRVLQRNKWWYASIDIGNGFDCQTAAMTGEELEDFIVEHSH